MEYSLVLLFDQSPTALVAFHYVLGFLSFCCLLEKPDTSGDLAINALEDLWEHHELTHSLVSNEMTWVLLFASLLQQFLRNS